MKSNLKLYPQKKIQPFDGMSITAEVWSEAHSYHTQTLNAHQHLLHGAGIVTGLEVVASDPANSIVFILPGAAVDSAGQMIVLPEAVAYDLGQKMEGKLRLLMLHREMKTQAENGESNAPAYVQDEFVIVARAETPDLPFVELARLERGDPHQAIHDAVDPYRPRVNEIDLRFRQNVCPPVVEPVLTGVCSLGKPAPAYTQGVIHLADALAGQTRFRLIVEDAIPLDAGLLRFGLIFLTIAEAAKLSQEQANALRTYLENGGKLLVDFDGKMTGEEISGLLRPAGIVLEKLTPAHAAYQKPNLFFFPPIAESQLWSWGGVVVCASGGYGALWSGQAPREQLSRGMLRDALEWGVNLVNYLLRQE